MTKASKLLTLIQNLLSLAFIRNVVLIFELVLIPLGVYALYQTNKALSLQRIANHQQNISTAWSILGTSSPGNSGKSHALNTLYQNGEELRGLIIDCHSMGGRFIKDPDLRCQGAPFFVDLLLQGGDKILSDSLFQTDENKYNLEEVLDPERCITSSLDFWDNSFSGAIFKNVTFYCAMIGRLDLTRTWLRNLNIGNSWLYDAELSEARYDSGYFLGNRVEGLVAKNTIFANVVFDGTYFEGVNWSGARFDTVSFNQVVLTDVNVSNADFCYFSNEAFPSEEINCPINFSDKFFERMWAWEDMPPKGLGKFSERLSAVKLCPTELREEYQKKLLRPYVFVVNRGYVKPEGC